MNNLQERFKYEFKEWIEELGSMPIEMLASEDFSQSYETRTMHIFKLENGKYATVIESGCSCYDPSLATIDVLKSKEDALEQFNNWRKQQKEYNR